MRCFRTLLGLDDGVLGMIMVIHTFGDYARFHPHLRTIVADGLARPNGTFYCFPKRELKVAAPILPGKHKISTPTIQNILGHAKLNTTEKFIQRISGDVHQAVDVLAEGRDFTEGTKKKAENPKSTPL